MGHIPDMTEISDGYYTYIHVGWLGSSVPSGEVAVPEKCHEILTHLINYHVPAVCMGSHQCGVCGASTECSEQADIGGNGEIYFPAGEDTSRIFTSPTMILHYIHAHSYSPPEKFCAALIAWWNSAHAAPCRKGNCCLTPSTFYHYDCLPRKWTKDTMEVYSGVSFDRTGSITSAEALEYIYKVKIKVVRGHEAEVAAEIQRWAFCPGNPKHPKG